MKPALAWAIAMCVRDVTDVNEAYARITEHIDGPNEALLALAQILVGPELRVVEDIDAARIDAIRHFSFRGAQCRVRRWPMPVPLDQPRLGVPSLPTIGDLADSLSIGVGELLWMADPCGQNTVPRLAHYRTRWVGKRKGGRRLLEVPKKRLRTIQRKLLRWLNAVPPHPAARGFRPGTNVIEHAAAHVDERWVLRVDLADFFARVRAARIRRTFIALGFSPSVARILTGLTTTHSEPAGADAVERTLYRSRHLPQGAPTSPVLANLAAWPLDVRLSSLATTLSLTYTRYADDLVMSGRWVHPDLSAQIGAIAHDEGFVVNHRKTRRMGSGRQQRVAGLVVNGATIGVPRADYDRLRAILHRCAANGLEAENRDNHVDFRAYLRGRIEWVSAGRPSRRTKLIHLFESIRD